MSALPTPLQTGRAVGRAFLPRLVQGRGWALAAIALLPALLAIFITTLIQAQEGGNSGEASKTALQVFHEVMVRIMLPVMAIAAAPAGVQEDLEQRTLPLLLVRPAPVWVLPFAKGSIWFAWGALWLLLAALGLTTMGGNLSEFPRQASALAFAFWAELAFMALLGLVFKRGTLWGALYLILWEGLVRLLPGNLQRLTFVHYVESITGTRGANIRAQDLLAQAQISSPVWASLLVLLLVGAVCWALCGWKLQTTPVGLAGREAEG